jgi:hypothetical protein
MIRIRTWKGDGDQLEPRIRRRGQFLAGHGSRTIPVRGELADVASPGLWTVRGQCASTADACPRTDEAAMGSRMLPVCERDCGRGLSADMDCSRTRIGRVTVLFSDCSWSRICRVRDHKRSISRGGFRYSPRPIRGRRILVKTRGKACPVLNMLRNTLSPFLLQLVSPTFQLGHDGLDASNLLDGL